MIGTTQMGFKVVPISQTSTVNERLALPIGRVMEEPQEESPTWTGLGWEGADVRLFGNNMTKFAVSTGSIIIIISIII